MDYTSVSLNRDWFLLPDPEDVGRENGYSESFDPEKCRRADLPARIAAVFPDCVCPVWYYKRFVREASEEESGELILVFDRVDLLCEVWLNGTFLGKHCQSEERFSWPVGEHLKEGENLLACRVYSPCSTAEGYDGLTLRTSPNRGRSHGYYTFTNSGGILGGVRLERLPAVRIADAHVRPDFFTGNVEVRVRIAGTLPDADPLGVSYTVSEGGRTILSGKADAEAGHCVLRFSVPERKPWSPDEPNLYTLLLRLNGEDGGKILRFGFRHLCVKNGYFFFNGRRIFLRCAHGIVGRKEAAEAKAMGFQAIRYFAALPPEDLLDYCDEIGLMIYEECAVSWGMSDYPDMPRHMADWLDYMMRRDRNHPSVVIRGIFNETPGGNPQFESPDLPSSEVFDFAVGHLPAMRRIDPDCLILLSSGRWDARPGIGSLSNPGSTEWECEWGAEEAGKEGLALRAPGDKCDPYIVGMGDNHLYPKVPMDEETVGFIRTLGQDTKPVFLSEYGVGCQLNVYRLFDGILRGGRVGNGDADNYLTQIRALEDFIGRFGMAGVYPHPEDFLTASIEKNARQRIWSVDPIRANPKICGYSLTSYGVSNEGVYSEPGRMIPGITEALRDAFAPLRWAVFPAYRCAYENRPFEVEAVLCSEDVLTPGTYTVRLSVLGKNGAAWEEEREFVIPAGDPLPPLAVTAFKGTVPGLPEGIYALEARLGESARRQPVCGEYPIRVLAGAPEEEDRDIEIGLCGEFGEAATWLSERYRVSDFREYIGKLILAGRLPEDGEEAARTEAELLCRAQEGCTVIFLDDRVRSGSSIGGADFMQKAGTGGARGIAGRRIYYRNWLYHVDCYAAPGSVFAGLTGSEQDCGILDMELWGDVYPSCYIADAEKPDFTHAAAFGTGLLTENRTLSALVLGEYAYGKGRIVVNTFRILDNLGRSPLADRLAEKLIGRYR